MTITFLLSADNPIGRFDASMLTDHQMMELFFKPSDTDPRDYCRSNGCDQDDACTWKGVTCSPEGNVTEVAWCRREMQISGSINFVGIPRRTKTIDFVRQSLCGDVDTSVLPISLESFTLQNCNFTGSLDMQVLPPRLKYFCVCGNAITAISSISHLPESLTDISIAETNLEQNSIFVGKLRDSFYDLDIADCDVMEIIFEDPEDARKIPLPY